MSAPVTTPVSTWTAANGVEHCGHDGHEIPDGFPVWVRGNIRRCEAHAPEHSFVDWDAVEAARQQHEARRIGDAATAITEARLGRSLRGGFSRATPATQAGLNQALKHFGIKGRRESRNPKLPAPRTPDPFAKVADVPDPKAAAFSK